MKRTDSMVVGVILAILAISYIGVTAANPQWSLPFDLRVTYLIYGAYIWVVLLFLIFIPKLFPREVKVSFQVRQYRFFSYLAIAIVFLLMEIFSTEVDFFTIIRSAVMFGYLSIAIRNFMLWQKYKKQS